MFSRTQSSSHTHARTHTVCVCMCVLASACVCWGRGSYICLVQQFLFPLNSVYIWDAEHLHDITTNILYIYRLHIYSIFITHTLYFPHTAEKACLQTEQGSEQRHSGVSCSATTQLASAVPCYNTQIPSISLSAGPRITQR